MISLNGGNETFPCGTVEKLNGLSMREEKTP